MEFTALMERVSRGIEIAGAVAIVGGLVWSLVAAAFTWREQDGPAAYVKARSTMGRGILLGLEILVAGDIIRTVAVEPTLQNVLVLALIVLIRTFLSFSLEIEIEGTVPWRRARRH